MVESQTKAENEATEPTPSDQNYNNLWHYFGANAPGTAYSNCTSTPLSSSTTRYPCQTRCTLNGGGTGPGGTYTEVVLTR